MENNNRNIIAENLENKFKKEMNEVLESINADGQVKRVEIDAINDEVKFVFNLHNIDNDLTWIE